MALPQVRCVRRKHIKGLPQPQFNEEDRPARSSWKVVAYRKTESGYECIYCSWSTRPTSKRPGGDIQQHCRKHFPALHKCDECGDAFHLKTGLHNHFYVDCPSCDWRGKKGSLSGHMRSTRCRSRQRAMAVRITVSAGAGGDCPD
jgi:ribosomal protein L34E